MSGTNPNSVGSEGAREQANCADCGRLLTMREQYRGDACERCEREYQHATTDPDDLYPRAA